MTEAGRERINRAARAIGAAERLLSEWPEFAAGRAYYAMLYIAEALLYELGLYRSPYKACTPV